MNTNINTHTEQAAFVGLKLVVPPFVPAPFVVSVEPMTPPFELVELGTPSFVIMASGAAVADLWRTYVRLDTDRLLDGIAVAGL
jgi:hypothetical protein